MLSCPLVEAQSGHNRTGAWWLGQNGRRMISPGVWQPFLSVTARCLSDSLRTARVDKNPLAHDPRNRILERRPRVGMMRRVGKTWRKNREIPSGLNDITDAPIQQYVRQIRDYGKRSAAFDDRWREHTRQHDEISETVV
jgi:hypothetical protein